VSQCLHNSHNTPDVLDFQTCGRNFISYFSFSVLICPNNNRRGFCLSRTLPAMKKLNLIRESVIETQGVFEDLDAVRDLESATHRLDHYFIDDDYCSEGPAYRDCNETRSNS
jgi:hypothetical protein